MNRGKIRNVLKEKTTNISALSAQVNTGFNKEDIHDFRVEIKTLRSFLRLLRAYDPHKNLKLTKKAKRLYHITGAIRDTQLELAKILDTKLQLPAYIDKLHRQIEARQNEWHKLYSPKIFRKLETKLCSPKYKSLSFEAFDNFRLTRMSEINQLTKAHHITESNIHLVRKKAKDILYVSKLALKKWQGATERVREQDLKLLNGLSDTIGQYHDEVVQLAHLKGFSMAKRPSEETKLKTKVYSRETKRLAKEKNRIVKKVKETLQKLDAPL